MKKSLILFSTSLLLSSFLLPSTLKEVKAVKLAPSEAIHDLIEGYKDTGSYTKKTTIGLNSSAIEDMQDCFHSNLTAAKRTTYYAPNKLLLANADGTVSAGSGSYVFDAENSEVKRGAATEDINDIGKLWSKISDPVSVGHTGATKLEDFYVTLDTFLATDYFANWNYDENEDYYYYKLTEADKAKDDNGVYASGMWGDFLNFCAPMLYAKSGRHFSADSLRIQTGYTNGVGTYLQMTMYLDDIDSGKLDDNQYLAEARVYQGNSIFEEKDEVGYILGDDSGQGYEFDKDPENSKHLVLKNMSYKKGNIIRVYTTKFTFIEANKDFKHNLSLGISKETGFADNSGQYIIPEDGIYDFYVDFNDDGSFKQVYVMDRSAKTLYVEKTWGDINGNKMFIQYATSGELSSSNNMQVQMTYSHMAGTNNDKETYKVTIPGNTTGFRFCYNKTDDAQTWVKGSIQTLGENNAYYFSDWNDGTPTMGSYTYSGK